MTITTQSTYTKFQEWLADCPTQIEDYQHNFDNVVVREVTGGTSHGIMKNMADEDFTGDTP